MRIGVLAWDLTEPEANSLVEFGRELGHEMFLFTLDAVRLGARRDDGGLPSVAIGGGLAAEDLDLVLCRPELRFDRIQVDYERFSLVETLSGARCVDPASTYFTVNNKAVSLGLLAQRGFPVVPTRTCSTFTEVAESIKDWDRPCVVKPSFGYGGTDVHLVRDAYREAPVVERMLEQYHVVLAQPYHAHPDGDFRLTVVGDDLPLSFSRVPARGEWRSNICLGATVEMREPPGELVDAALHATKELGLTISGIDFVPTEDGFRIIEVNTSPGWCLPDREIRRRVLSKIFATAVG